MNKAALSALAVAALVIVVGAGALYISTRSDDPMMTSSAKSAEAPSDAVTTDAIDIKGFEFAPGDVTVKVGTTVTWTNRDSVKHNVAVDSGDGPDGPLLAKDETYSYTFDTPGAYPYHCDPHRSMTATVYVTE